MALCPPIGGLAIAAEVSDAELIHNILATDDARAFGVLVQRYQATVRSLLLRLCKDSSRADDLAQETFLRAYEKLDQVDPQRVRPWLGRIAYRQFLQWYRASRRYGEVVDLWSQSAETETQPPDALDLDRYLAILSGSEREAVILCLGFGLTHQEAAQSLDRPLGTVKSQIVRAKARIVEHFETPAIAIESKNKEHRCEAH